MEENRWEEYQDSLTDDNGVPEIPFGMTFKEWVESLKREALKQNN